MRIGKNIRNNRDHYDRLYGGMVTEGIAKKLENVEELLHKQQKRILSMRAFYSGDFQKRLKGKRVLEIGAGNGLNAFFMAHFGAYVSAQDISEASEKKIVTLNEAVNAEIESYSGDLRELDFAPHSFDWVVGKSVIHHLTHELEDAYYQKIAQLLKKDGAVRFVEPAHNLPLLRKMRLMLPEKDRPSSLNRKKYRAYQDQHPHPERSNSSKHFLQIGRKYFGRVEVVPFGQDQALGAWLPSFLRNKLKKPQGRLARWISFKLAKVQVIEMREPLT